MRPGKLLYLLFLLALRYCLKHLIIFSNNSYLDDYYISLPDVPSRNNLKLRNISVTTNFDSPRVFGPDCIPSIVLKNCEPELAYILTKFFNICLKESCFPEWWKASTVVHVFKNVVERSTAKNCNFFSFLFVITELIEILVNKRVAEQFDKCGPFPDFPFGFSSSQFTADFLVVICDRNARAFIAPRATKAVTLHIPRAFEVVWHSIVIHKVNSQGSSGRVLNLILSFLINRRLPVVLDGMSSY